MYLVCKLNDRGLGVACEGSRARRREWSSWRWNSIVGVIT